MCSCRDARGLVALPGGERQRRRAAAARLGPTPDPAPISQPARARSPVRDWGSFRTRLQNIGVTYDLDYTTESVLNASAA